MVTGALLFAFCCISCEQSSEKEEDLTVVSESAPISQPKPNNDLQGIQKRLGQMTTLPVEDPHLIYAFDQGASNYVVLDGRLKGQKDRLKSLFMLPIHENDIPEGYQKAAFAYPGDITSGGKVIYKSRAFVGEFLPHRMGMAFFGKSLENNQWQNFGFIVETELTAPRATRVPDSVMNEVLQLKEAGKCTEIKGITQSE